MTIPGTTLDISHLFLWQWELAFFVTGVVCILPFLGVLIMFLLRLALMWFVFDASLIVYRETAQKGNAVAGFLWAATCLVWPLNLAIWFRLYADSPLQLVEEPGAGRMATTPVDRRTWKAPRLGDESLQQRMDDDEFDHRPAAARVAATAQHHHPQESIRYPHPHPDRDPLANDGDPEVGELRDGEWQPIATPKSKWARPKIAEPGYEPPAEPWKTLGA
jgi:hypothetical protein